MRRLSKIILLAIAFVLASCGATPVEPTAAPTLTPFPTREAQPTRTSVSNPATSPTSIFGNQSAPTPLQQATAFIPATFTPAVVNNSNIDTLLTNGRGITNGAVVSNGEFQVEGYCNILNTSYGVAEDGRDWYCTFNDQRALTLRQQQFNDICQRTYSNPNAIAIQVNNGQQPAYQWRCYELAFPPTPTSSAPPQLLNNGRGMSTGAVMNGGEVEVEGYCRAINPNYGVAVDENFWYCTENGTRILTLGVAEFDDICIQTYSNPAAYSEQIQNNDRPAYRWRCFAIPG